MSRPQPTVEQALRRAYESPGACPPPETFLAEEMAALDPETRASVESHAERCPACAAERDLARTFESAGSMSASENRDVEHMVRRLKRGAPTRKNDSGLARLLRFPALGGLQRSPAFRVAMAAVLVLVVGFAVQTTRTGAPQLPDTAVDTVVRGGQLEVISPVGEIAVVTDAFVWQASDGAVSYLVTLKTVDDTVLWETTSDQPSVSLPEPVRSQLHPAVTYAWKVEALDAQGARVAGSGWVDFRVQAVAADE
jgi:hypothetical protein